MLKGILGGITIYLLFLFLRYLIIKNDDENNLKIKKIQEVFIAINSICCGFIIHFTNTNIFSKILLLIIFALFMICGYTDKQTFMVYRFYSVLLIICSIIFALINYSYYIKQDTLLTTIGACIVYYIFATSNLFGFGDGLVLIANSIIIIFFSVGYFKVETILWHLIAAMLLMIICNLKQMNWKKFRFKKQVAFVPYIYIATLLIITINLIQNYKGGL